MDRASIMLAVEPTGANGPPTAETPPTAAVDSVRDDEGHKGSANSEEVTEMPPVKKKKKYHGASRSAARARKRKAAARVEAARILRKGERGEGGETEEGKLVKVDAVTTCLGEGQVPAWQSTIHKIPLRSVMDSSTSSHYNGAGMTSDKAKDLEMKRRGGY
jgi:hypothetical protein